LRLARAGAQEVGNLCHNFRAGSRVLAAARMLPYLELDAQIQPITRGIMRVTLKIRALFDWAERYHGALEPWCVHRLAERRGGIHGPG
jgi:activating signal cointegrator complex subunit 3